jgi:hypothetical protein
MIVDSAIGGAIVQRPFNMGGRYVKRGENLTAAQVLAMPVNNRRALIDNRQIDIYPPQATSADPGAELHVVHRGAGAYDVILGRRLNDAPLTKAEAELLAAGSPRAS